MEKHTKVNSFNLQLGMTPKDHKIYDKPSLHILFGWGEYEMMRKEGQLRVAGSTTCDPSEEKVLYPPYARLCCAGVPGFFTGSGDNFEFTGVLSGGITLKVSLKISLSHCEKMSGKVKSRESIPYNSRTFYSSGQRWPPSPLPVATWDVVDPWPGPSMVTPSILSNSVLSHL